MTNFFTDKVTIYNDIPATDTAPRCFHKNIIQCCLIQEGAVEKIDGTIRKVVNAKTVITKDTEHYISPENYRNMPENERETFFTVQTGDYIVFGECDDTVQNAQDFAELQIKHKEGGMKVTSVNASIKGMTVDNILITNA